MTIAELITKLQEFEPGTPVVLHEEPHGLELVRSVRLVAVPGDGGFEGAESVVVIDTYPAEFYPRSER
jgi:hypothetical protein